MTGTSIKTILAFALLVGVASQANADIWRHVDQQASDIKCAASSLRKEVDHYRSTRYFGQLIGATARLKGQAIHVHNIAKHSHCPKALKIAVRELDRAFHDAEFLFDSVEQDAAYGDGYVRGNTAHVKQQLIRIGNCITNLNDDLRRLTRPQTTYRPPAPVYQPVRYDVYRGGDRYGDRYGNYGRPAYGGRGHGHGSRGYDRSYSRYGNNSGFGISIGGGSSRITFRF